MGVQIMNDNNNSGINSLVVSYEIWYEGRKRTFTIEEIGEITDEITEIFEKRNLHWKMV